MSDRLHTHAWPIHGLKWEFAGAILIQGWFALASTPLNYRGTPFNVASYKAGQQAQADQPALPLNAFVESLIAWDGQTSTNGSGWLIGNTTNATVTLDEPDSRGKRVIHFHGTSGNYRYLAFGWEWASPIENGIDLHQYAAISFSLKVSGAKPMQELFFGFSSNQPAPISIRPFQPGFADGGWHQVTIPTSAMKWSPAPEIPPVRGISLKTFVWNPCDFDVFIDQIRFLKEASPTRPYQTSSIPNLHGSAIGQTIPGRIECAFYDLGGEGVAYHDTTPINILSAVLNQQALHQRPHATAHHWNFRKDEGVDVSFVKDFADLNHPNPTDPPVNQLYIGGTEDGEWCNYTVNVQKAGTYRIIAAYGNIAGMKQLRFSIDGNPASEMPCPVVTGGMHRWTREEVGRITFGEAGSHLLTLHYERGYNLGYFDFQEAQ